jgi:hypothetical protein
VQWRDVWRRLDPGQGATEQAHRKWQVVVDASRDEETTAATDAWRARLEQAVEQAENARAQARRELDVESRTRQEATARAEQAESRIDGLEQRLDAVHTERAVLDEELRRQRIASSAIAAQLAEARSEVDELAKSLEETRTQLTRSDADLQAALATVATRTALAEQAEAQRDELQSELTAERSAHALTRAALDGVGAARPREDAPAESAGAAEPSAWNTSTMLQVRDRCAAIDRTETRWSSSAPPILATLTTVAILAPVGLRRPAVEAAPVIALAIAVSLILLALMVTLPKQLYRFVAVPYGPPPSVLPGGVSVTLLATVLVATFEGGRHLAGFPAGQLWTREGIVPVLRFEPAGPGGLSTPEAGTGLMFGAMLAAVLVLVAVGATAIGVIVRRVREHLDPVAAVVVPAIAALDRLHEHSPSEADSKRAVNDALSRLATNLETVFPYTVNVSGAKEQKDMRELGARAARTVRSWELLVARGDPEQLRQLSDGLTHIVSAVGTGNYGGLPTTDTGSPLYRRGRWITGATRALPVFPPLALSLALPLQWSALAKQASGTQYILASVVAVWMVSGVARLVDPGALRQSPRRSRSRAEAVGPAPDTDPTPPGSVPAAPESRTGDTGRSTIDLTVGQNLRER